jgi:hypothetical protein
MPALLEIDTTLHGLITVNHIHARLLMTTLKMGRNQKAPAVFALAQL